MEDVFKILKNSTNRTDITVHDVEEWASTTIKDIRNDELGWGENGHLLLDAVRNESDRCPNIAVLVNFAQTTTASFTAGVTAAQVPKAQQTKQLIPKQQEAPTDIVLNLQYFFPYCDQVFLHNHNIRIILVVICSNESDAQRVKCYLSAIELEKPWLCICTVMGKASSAVSDPHLSSVRSATRSYGSLLPLFCIGQKVPSDSKLAPTINQLTLSTITLGTNSDLFTTIFVDKRPTCPHRTNSHNFSNPAIVQ